MERVTVLMTLPKELVYELQGIGCWHGVSLNDVIIEILSNGIYEHYPKELEDEFKKLGREYFE